MSYRYYTTQRPPAPGAIPMRPRPKRVRDFGRRETTRHGFPAWGYVEYDEPLPDEQVDAYELRRAK